MPATRSLIDPAPTSLPFITGPSMRGYSYYGSWKHCPRKFAFKYRNPVVGPEAGARATSLGSMVHALLAMFYLRLMGIPVPDADKVLDEESARLAMDGGEVEQGRKIFRAYRTYYAGDLLVPTAVEQEIVMAFVWQGGDRFTMVEYNPLHAPPRGVKPGIGDHVLYSSRVDLFARPDPQMKIDAMDHKTTFRILRGRKATERRYGPHGQMHGLIWAGRMAYGGTGEFSERVILNLIQSRGDNLQFARKPPPPAPRMVEDFPRLIVSTARQIAAMDAAYGDNPMRWDPAAHEQLCTTVYNVSHGGCSYDRACRMGV